MKKAKYDTMEEFSEDCTMEKINHLNQVERSHNALLALLKDIEHEWTDIGTEKERKQHAISFVEAFIGLIYGEDLTPVVVGGDEEEDEEDEEDEGTISPN